MDNYINTKSYHDSVRYCPSVPANGLQEAFLAPNYGSLSSRRLGSYDELDPPASPNDRRRKPPARPSGCFSFPAGNSSAFGTARTNPPRPGGDSSVPSSISAMTTSRGSCACVSGVMGAPLEDGEDESGETTRAGTHAGRSPTLPPPPGLRMGNSSDDAEREREAWRRKATAA